MNKPLLVFMVLLSVCLFSCHKNKYEERSGGGAVSNERKAKDYLSLSFIGDVMAHWENFRMPDYNDIWSGVKNKLLSDDFSFGNLEFVVDPDKPNSTFPRFNIEPDYVRAAIEGGLDVFSLANNHTADQGADSVLKTLSAMEGLKNEYGEGRLLYFSGINRGKNDFLKPVYWEKNNISLGFLAVTQFSNKGGGLSYINIANYKNSGQKKELLDSLTAAAEGVDIFILSYHGGVEYARDPEDAKKRFFEEIFETGVDIIWAHHPHVLQPWELREVNGEAKLVMYSLGNFISGQMYYLDPLDPNYRKYTGESAIMQVFALKDEVGISYQVRPAPIVNYSHPTMGIVARLYENILNEDMGPDWRYFYQSREAELYSMLKIPLNAGTFP